MEWVIVLASLALLLGGALLLQTGCTQLLGDGPQETAGRQIRLNVLAPVSATGIEVSEYKVTGLLIELRDAQGELLRTIEWDAIGVINIEEHESEPEGTALWDSLM